MITEPFIKDLKSHLCKERWLFLVNQQQSDEMAKKKYEKIEQITEKYENF